VGVAGWEAVVFEPGNDVSSDRPLPLAISHTVGNSHVMYSLVSFIGLFGLVASFHGIILVAGRATFEFGRVKYAPQVLGKVHKKFKTPANALLINMGIGIIALLTGKTGEIITIACFGALSLYIISMISLIRLRNREPEMKRPFKVPFYPFSPIIALVISLVAFLSITIFNPLIALIYFGIMGITFIWFKIVHKD